MSLLPCECRSCSYWDGEGSLIITCNYTECICGVNVNLLCGDVDGSGKTTPRYVCPRMGSNNCGYEIAACDVYFKEYKTIVGHASEYLQDVTGNTCLCEKPAKVVVEKVTVHAETLCLDDELQLFYKCKNSICTYKKSVPQLEISRIRCVCRRCCKFENGIYSCEQRQCGTYFHEWDSITFLQTMITMVELENHAFVYLPTRAKQLPCGHGTGILKYRYNKRYTTGELILECKDLFCDSTVNAIVQPK